MPTGQPRVDGAMRKERADFEQQVTPNNLQTPPARCFVNAKSFFATRKRQKLQRGFWKLAQKRAQKAHTYSKIHYNYLSEAHGVTDAAKKGAKKRRCLRRIFVTACCPTDRRSPAKAVPAFWERFSLLPLRQGVQPRQARPFSLLPERQFPDGFCPDGGKLCVPLW